MEEVERRFRDQLDEMKRVWQPRLGIKSLTPHYDFSRLAPAQRVARDAGTGHNATRVETLYEHLQDEIGALNAQLGDDEYPVVLFVTASGDAIQVGSIGYRNPDLLVLDGLDESQQPVRMLSQAGSVQFVLKRIKADPKTPKPTHTFQFSGNHGPG